MARWSSGKVVGPCKAQPRRVLEIRTDTQVMVRGSAEGACLTTKSRWLNQRLQSLLLMTGSMEYGGHWVAGLQITGLYIFPFYSGYSPVFPCLCSHSLILCFLFQPVGEVTQVVWNAWFNGTSESGIISNMLSGKFSQ